MDQRGRGCRNPLRTRQSIFMCKTYNPAHVYLMGLQRAKRLVTKLSQ
jgi:hypothetical protein